MPHVEAIEFVGLIRNRDLRALTHGELVNAFRKAGWTEWSFTGRPHFVAELVKDGPVRGILTLGHLERAMRDGETRAGKHGRTLRVLTCGAYVAYEEREARLITFSAGEPGTG